MLDSSRASSLRSLPFGFRIRFPHGNGELGQDEEWFEFDLDGETRRLRIHDYAGLYRVPGLYEALVYGELACKSPVRLANLFDAILADQGIDPADLRVLDLGAGNGMAAEELAKIRVGHFVGLDLIPEAALAADRDRPALFADYLVADVSNLDVDEDALLQDHQLNCLVTVAALGFGDIPPIAFGTAFNSITPKGWLGITIKEDFLSSEDDSGFARLLKMMIDQKIIEVQGHQRYCHRLSIRGEKIFYIAIVARKQRHIPLSLFDTIDDLAVTKFGDTDPSHAAMFLGA